MAGKNGKSGDFEKGCRDNLVGVARAYAAATDLAMATVSKKFHGKHSFFDDFAAGRCSMTLSKIDDMLKAFGTSWPPGKPRPSLQLVRMRLGTKGDAA